MFAERAIRLKPFLKDHHLLNDNRSNINAKCGSYGNALQTRSLLEQNDVVHLVLDNGTDIHIQDE